MLLHILIKINEITLCGDRIHTQAPELVEFFRVGILIRPQGQIHIYFWNARASTDPVANYLSLYKNVLEMTILIQ